MYLTSELLSKPGYVHGFSTRRGGVSGGAFASLNLGWSVGDEPGAVEENHERLRQATGLEAARFATVRQVHGATVRRIDHGLERPFDGGDADALITDRPGWIVGVRTADCVPILIAGPGVVGAVHAGWRGTAARIVVETVRAIEAAYRVPAEQLVAAIGPSIGGPCYPVGREVIDGLAEALRGSPGGLEGVIAWRGGEQGERPHADLREANRRLLLEAGLKEESVDLIDVCVHCDAERFYSHRRDQGNTGRMLNFIALRA